MYLHQMLYNSLMHNKFFLLGDYSKVGMHEWSVGLVVHAKLESTRVTQIQLDYDSKKGASLSSRIILSPKGKDLGPRETK